MSTEAASVENDALDLSWRPACGKDYQPKVYVERGPSAAGKFFGRAATEFLIGIEPSAMTESVRVETETRIPVENQQPPGEPVHPAQAAESRRPPFSLCLAGNGRYSRSVRSGRDGGGIKPGV